VALQEFRSLGDPGRQAIHQRLGHGQLPPEVSSGSTICGIIQVFKSGKALVPFFD
jgi:hypothetical protein